MGAADPARNPLAVARLPTFAELLGGARLVAPDLSDPPAGGRGSISAIDANLDMEGLPQSGTGQTTLLTGENAASRMGRHFGPWVPTALRGHLSERSLFREATRRGHAVAFANAYPAGAAEREEGGGRRPGAFPFAARSASLLVRDEASVRKGDALVSSITTDRWRRHMDPGAPRVEAAEAGLTLAAIAATHDLTLFAHYDTDYVGHRGSFDDAVAAVERVDSFLGGVLRGRSDDTLVLLTSDHGNLEDFTAGHTRNPVPFLAVGPGANDALATVHSIAEVAPLILETLGRGVGAEGGRADGKG